jgi:hypothetical protein
MNSETSESITTMNGPGATGLNANVVHRVAQKAHETVDKLEQTVSSGSEKVMSIQEEYGAYAREQIKMHPLSTVGVPRSAAGKIRAERAAASGKFRGQLARWRSTVQPEVIAARHDDRHGEVGPAVPVPNTQRGHLTAMLPLQGA